MRSELLLRFFYDSFKVSERAGQMLNFDKIAKRLRVPGNNAYICLNQLIPAQANISSHIYIRSHLIFHYDDST